MRFIILFLLFLGLTSARPQNFLSELKSVFGIDDDPKPTSVSLVKPATAATTTQKSSSQTNTVTPSVRTISRVTRTSSSTDSTTTDSSTSSSSSSSTVTPTSTTSTTTPPPPPPTSTAAPIPTTVPNSSKSQSSVSGGGIAAAVIMTLAILAALAWLIFRYHPGIRARWLARQEKKQQERSYRAALDGPFASKKDGSSPSTPNFNRAGRKSMLASFFAPRTVNLGHGQSIRRKPVNWGVGVPPMPSSSPRSPDVAELPGVPMEKVALTKMAAPMARTESARSGVSLSSGLHRGLSYSTVSSVTTSPQPSPAPTQKELPPMPPIPVPPTPADKRDMHRILTRKSIFELA